MNTTETFWSVDGVSLQTFAWNIETLGGDRMAPPPVQGDDLQIPHRSGTIWTPRDVGSRVITLGMWVQGSDENGDIPDDENARRTFDRNWRMLRKLLGRFRTQFVLTKRFWVETQDLLDAGVDVSGLPQEAGWTLYQASAKASYVGGLSPQMSGPARAAFTVDLLLSDPYFYSEPLRFDFSTSTEAGDPGPVRVAQILGDDITTKVFVDLEGPLSAPRFTQSNPLTDEQILWMTYATDVADGDSAHIDISRFRSTHTDAETTYRSSGHVRHFGDWFWFPMTPGSTKMSLSVQAGTGTAAITYSPAWL